jgi:hypothetical protein
VTTVSLGIDKSFVIGIKSYNSGRQNKQPTYFEWDGTTLTLHPTKEKTLFQKKLCDIETYEETYRYMQKELAKTTLISEISDIQVYKNNKYVMLLVRPTGFKTLKEVRGYFEQMGIDVGYEPIYQDWRVRIR